MRVLNTIAEVRAALREARRNDLKIGLVPTMGALHAGHLSLVRAARAQNGLVVVSIFVNPTQFGPNEDFSQYPRTLETDLSLLEAEGVDLVFVPSVEEIYPAGASTFVTVEELQDRLDGSSRPGHFRGVATVVAKLFHIVAPDHAYFGQKDAAQVAVLRRMVRDLNFDLDLVVCPIVREADGLAMSSRNRYLNPTERKQALVLSRAVEEVRGLFSAGEAKAAVLIAAAGAVLASEPEVRLDYLQIVDPETLAPIGEIKGPALLAIAAMVGTTRLIDNVVLSSGHIQLFT